MTKDQLKIIEAVMFELSVSDAMAKEDCQRIACELKRLLYMEESGKKRGKFNLYDYVSKEVYSRPIMTGVYRDNGMMVATNAMILVAVENDNQNDPNEGKVINKKGEEMIGRYPNWRAIIPSEDKITKVAYNSDAINDCVVRAKTEERTFKENRYIYMGYNELSFYRHDLLSKFDKFVVAYPDCDIYVTNMGMLFARSGENICLCMPIMPVSVKGDRIIKVDA